MSEIDFQKMLDNMSIGGTGKSPIMDVYEILPFFDSVQMKLWFEMKKYIIKWELTDAEEQLTALIQMMKTNKNLSMMGSKNLKDLLAAQTQSELIKGVSVRTSNDSTIQGQGGN